MRNPIMSSTLFLLDVGSPPDGFTLEWSAARLHAREPHRLRDEFTGDATEKVFLLLCAGHVVKAKPGPHESGALRIIRAAAHQHADFTAFLQRPEWPT